MSTDKNSVVTEQQAAALVRFAEQYGRGWKDELHFQWMRSNYPLSPQEDRPLLQQVRNHLGGRWLLRTSLPKLREIAGEQRRAGT
jgi:hypothetical protein